MDLKITIIQTDLLWESIDDNLRSFSEKIADIKDAPDLIVLPEMFTTGFSMNSAQMAEETDGKSVQRMRATAQQYGVALVGSLIIKEGGSYFNRLFFVFPDGSLKHYDKRHLFGMAGEERYYKPGEERLVVNYKGWNICPLICYDLRFPVWARNHNSEYDCLIYIANWPEKRSEHWKKLLLARAIENQCYTIGVNRVGVDDNGLSYSGDSAVITPNGDVVSTLKAGQQSEETVVLSKTNLEEVREKMPFLKDADAFKILDSALA